MGCSQADISELQTKNELEKASYIDWNTYRNKSWIVDKKNEKNQVKYDGYSVSFFGKKICVIPKMDISFGHTAVAIQKDKNH